MGRYRYASKVRVTPAPRGGDGVWMFAGKVEDGAEMICEMDGDQMPVTIEVIDRFHTDERVTGEEAVEYGKRKDDREWDGGDGEQADETHADGSGDARRAHGVHGDGDGEESAAEDQHEDGVFDVDHRPEKRSVVVTPHDYDSDDAFDDDRGLERCPHCGTCYSANGLYIGPVWDKSGRRYEYYADADAGTVMFCEDCWPELEANMKQSENRTLGDFA